MHTEPVIGDLPKRQANGGEYDFDGGSAEHDGCCLGSICAISIRADVEILPNTNKTTEAQPHCGDLIQHYEIATDRRKKR